MALKTQTEKRKHTRYPLTDDTVAVSHSGIGSVLDISEGGIAIKYLKPKELSDECKALVISGERDFLVAELPIKVVRKGEVETTPEGDAITQTVGVKFNSPDPDQHAQIKHFISILAKN